MLSNIKTKTIFITLIFYIYKFKEKIINFESKIDSYVLNEAHIKQI